MRIKDDKTIIEELKEKIGHLEAKSRHLENELKLLKQEYDAVSEWNFELVSFVEERVRERESESELYRKQLDQNNLELNLMLDSCPAMIFFKDVNLRYVRVNSEFSNKIGYPVSRIIGKKYNELFEDVNPWYVNVEEKILESGEAADILSGPVKTAKGELELLVKKVPHKDLDGNVVGIIGFAIDISDLRRAEREKSNLENKLVRARKLEALGEMASCVAHDLNQLLTGIISYPDLLSSRLPEDSGAEKYLKAIKQSGLRAAAITRDLLTLGRKKQHRERINLAEVIDEYISSVEFGLLQTRFPEVKLKFEVKSGETDILGSPVHLSQMLMNMVSNAFEAVAEKNMSGGAGEVRLCVEPLFNNEEVSRYELESYVVLRIEDDGKGIGLPPEDINRIFDPFYSSKKLGKSGSGLGMTVVKQVVDEHDGFIFVSSKDNGGTTFDIYLPVAGKSSEATALTSKGILLVDLNGNSCIEESHFTAEGFHVTRTISSGDALTRLKSYNFRMVFIITPGGFRSSCIAELIALIENAGDVRTVIVVSPEYSEQTNEIKRTYKRVEFMPLPQGEVAGKSPISSILREEILL